MLNRCKGFNDHISGLCKKAGRKISALVGVIPFMGLSKRKLLMKGFSQFSYCTLIWMRHSRSNNKKMDMLHERCLRVIYHDKQSSFTVLLKTVLSQFTLETFKGFQLKCLGPIMDIKTINEQYIQAKDRKSLQCKTYFWVFKADG